MRILMVNHEFTITGASTVFFRLAMHLRERGHELTVLPVNPEDGPMAARYREAGIPIETTAVPAQFGLVLANTICAAPVVVQVAEAAPTIWLVHEAEVGLNLLVRYPAWIGAFARAAAVVYDMPFQHDVFRSFTYQLDPSKFHAIPCGVDVDPGRIARHRVPPKSGVARVVQVGTIEPRKRPADVVRAVSRLGGDVECVICGKFYQIDDDARAIVAAAPARYRLIEGLSDDEVLAWAESADVFVLASGSETQGLAAYEAALLGRPLVLSDLLCYRGIFTHGQNCLLYPPGNAEMLAQSLGMLIRSPALARSLAQAGQKTVRRYSNRVFLASFEALMLRTTAQVG